MANEAVCVVEKSLPINYICSNTTGIEKGAVLKLSDPRTVALSDGAEDYVAGICSGEKIASNGETYVGVYEDGEFEMVLSGSVTAGQAVSTHGNANIVKVSTATAVGCKTLGIALEDGTEGETIHVKLNPGCNNTAYS